MYIHMYFLANEDFSFQEKKNFLFYFVNLEQFSGSIKTLMPIIIICSYSHLCYYCHLSSVFGKTAANIYGTISVFYKLNKSVLTESGHIYAFFY